MRSCPLVTLLLLLACNGPVADDTALDADADADADADSDADTDTDTEPQTEWAIGEDTVTVEVTDVDTLERTYTLTTTHALRDNDPPSGSVTFQELEGQLVLRSGNLLLDGLFAMSMHEVRQLSVSQITDGAFNDGNPVDCECFQTGEKWHYVWTRDTAYAVDLALGLIEPERSLDSLRFKISERKAAAPGGSAEFVQDTGTGGSWPVSSDRVALALGIGAVADTLPYDQQLAFWDEFVPPLLATHDTDRTYVWDGQGDGLYRGEQSFLDWREQTYPQWTADEPAHIAMSKSLSTNVLHDVLMQEVSRASVRRGDIETFDVFFNRRRELEDAIDDELWDGEAGLYRTYSTTELDRAPVGKYDWLGNALAVLYAIPDQNKAERIVASWPHTETGPPVYWPQQPLVPVYHNRAQWPFVTAYGVLAAAKVGNSEVMDRGCDALIRGAALNLSNMENFEFIGQENLHDDGEFSGPIVNSRRQLWSVAAFIGMVTKGWFGYRATDTGASLWPQITHGLRNTWLAGSDQVALYNLPLYGKTVDVVIDLPPANGGGAGFFGVASGSFDDNGDLALQETIGWELIANDSVWHFGLTAAAGPAVSATVVADNGDFRDFWSPRDPAITGIEVFSNHLRLTTDPGGESGVLYNIYRDGELAVEGRAETTWDDTSATDHGSVTHCYAVETEFPNGHRSQHSPPVCWWGASNERVHSVMAADFAAVGGTLVDNHGREHHENWGEPGHTLTAGFSATASGEHYVQYVYGNGAGSVDTGITAAHKWVTVRDSSDTVVGEGAVVMPHLGSWDRWADSTLVPVTLTGGQTYSIELSDAPNMSYFGHFDIYTGGLGGGAGTYNFVNVAELKVLEMGG